MLGLIIKKQILLIVLSFFLLIGCSDRSNKKVVEWNLQSQASESSVDFQELLKFAENIRIMSAGRLIIHPFPGGEITNGPDIFVAVSEGRIEMGNGWPNWWSGQHPGWAVMNAGPFDFMNLDASMMFFLVGDGTRLANQLSIPKGVIWRPAWWPGMEFGLVSNMPVHGLDDLKGKKVRIGPGLPSEVLAEVSGAFTIPLVPREILPALESGAIDAVEWTTAGGVWDLGIHENNPHAIVPAIWQPSVLSDFLIHKESYEALPGDLRAILDTAIKSFTLTTTLIAKVEDFAATKRLIAGGMKIHKWTESDMQRWRDANQIILKRYSDSDPYTKTLLEAKRDFKRTYNEYYEYFGQYE